jgi:hypothetical protein
VTKPDSEWVFTKLTQWIMDHDGGTGLCWACKKEFKLNDEIVYELPRKAGKKILKVSRHADCT